MRTRSAQYMRELLNATGGYRLTGESDGDWELIAAGSQLDLLSEELETLYGDLFIEGATADCLNLWESWLRPQRSAASIEQRRRMLMEQMAVNPGKGTLAEDRDMIYAAGVHGRAAEGEDGLILYCGGLLGLTEAEVRKELDALLPAHLPWKLEPVFDWSTMEASGRSFANWETLDLTWAELDSLTREEVLERGNNHGIN